ncbi:OmpA family protein [Sideroxydans sp.]
MKNTKSVFKTLSAIGLAGCTVMGSSAAMAVEEGWLIGINAGQSMAKIDAASIRAQLLNSGLTTTTLTERDRKTAFKLFGGYKFSNNFAVEGGYYDLGEFGYTATTTPAGTLIGNIKLRGVNIDAVVMFPFTEKFSAFGRLGLQYAEAKDTFTSTGLVPTPANPNPSKTAANYKVGGGLQYDFTPSLGMRLEGERYRIDDAAGSKGDINMVSLGLVYQFGKEKPAPVKQAAAAPAVAPAPVVVIVPVKMQEYCTILDLQFEIKQDSIQRDDKEKLAVVGTFMKKYPKSTAVIEGHSDSVGASAYNQKLSQQRADSVVEYLVNDLKIDASRLSAIGYGDTRPIADNSTPEGQQANRRIGAVIACATDYAGLKVAPARFTVAMEVGFDSLKSEVKPEYFAELGRVAEFMQANPTVLATVEGHAAMFDGAGKDQTRVSAKDAMALSQRRAQSVVNYLVDKRGVSRSRLSTSAFGQTRRVSYGTSAEGRQENRRVNIIFNYAKR